MNYENGNINGENYVINKVLKEKLTRLNPILFDVGANIGNFSMSLLDIFPNSKLYSFEPHPKNFKKLAGLIEDKANCYELALGNENTEAEIFDYENSDGSEHASLLENVIKDIHHSATIKYKIGVKTLDTFLEENNLSTIDFLKIDTEGFEYDVLTGAENSLRSNKIKIILFEFNSMNIVRGVFFRNFEKLLENYNLYRVLPSSLLPIGKEDEAIFKEIFAYQNILAINRTV